MISRPLMASFKAPVQAMVVAAAALWLTPACADKSDRSQPINFASDSARVDDARRVNILKGNVEMTKGTIVLRSALVEVHQGADGSQKAVATGGKDGRAYFKQRREGLDEYIEGESERIDYDGKTDLVTFTGRAVMRRLTGATASDEVVGQTIVYDNKTEVFQVMGGAGSAAGNGRVKGVIAPRKEKADKPERTGAAEAADAARLAITPTINPALNPAMPPAATQGARP
ncbi:MAG: lipopolysaccharide transport periplasmic protein LptA [Pseudomonadota bacterium]|jgi:lipopolysaccharide export system protein LptA